MQTPEEKADREKTEKHNAVTRGISLAAVVISVIAAIVSAGVSSDNTKAAEKTALIGAGYSQDSLCLAWGSFVLQQQAAGDAARAPATKTDEEIDRVGIVIYSRAAAEQQNIGSAVDAQGRVSPAATPVIGTVPLKSIAEHCGSAEEIRAAKSGGPLTLSYSSKG